MTKNIRTLTFWCGSGLRGSNGGTSVGKADRWNYIILPLSPPPSLGTPRFLEFLAQLILNSCETSYITSITTLALHPPGISIVKKQGKQNENWTSVVLGSLGVAEWRGPVQGCQWGGDSTCFLEVILCRSIPYNGRARPIVAVGPLFINMIDGYAVLARRCSAHP